MRVRFLLDGDEEKSRFVQAWVMKEYGAAWLSSRSIKIQYTDKDLCFGSKTLTYTTRPPRASDFVIDMRKW